MRCNSSYRPIVETEGLDLPLFMLAQMRTARHFLAVIKRATLRFVRSACFCMRLVSIAGLFAGNTLSCRVGF